MYAFRRTLLGFYDTLVELTAEELRAERRAGRFIFNRCTAQEARKWVKEGGHHETPLWVDMDGKVRYAKG